jgi:hypothetical protein
LSAKCENNLKRNCNFFRWQKRRLVAYTHGKVKPSHSCYDKHFYLGGGGGAQWLWKVLRHFVCRHFAYCWPNLAKHANPTYKSSMNCDLKIKDAKFKKNGESSRRNVWRRMGDRVFVLIRQRHACRLRSPLLFRRERANFSPSEVKFFVWNVIVH